MRIWIVAVSTLLFLGLVGAPTLELVPIYLMWDRHSLENVIKEYEGRLQTRPNDPLAMKALGIAYHNLGVQKVSGAVAKAVAYLERARQALSQDAEVLAYLGSAITMVARDSWNPVTKVREVGKGTKLIDMAVARDTDNVAVRFVRANNSLALPRFFNRAHYAKTDFQHLLKLSAADGEQAKLFSPELIAEIHFKLGEVYEDTHQEELAKDQWTKAVEIAPNSTWGRQAQKRL